MRGRGRQWGEGFTYGGGNRGQRVIAGRRLSRGEGVHMPLVQVSVRQTEYTSKNELQIQNDATLSSCVLQQQNIHISGSITMKRNYRRRNSRMFQEAHGESNRVMVRHM